MAKSKIPSKVVVNERGGVFLRRPSGHHNRIGRIEQIHDKTWRSCAMLPSRASGQPYCKDVKSKSAAVLNIVKHWRMWIGLPPGRTNY